jgi:hypothetical protein
MQAGSDTNGIHCWHFKYVDILSAFVKQTMSMDISIRQSILKFIWDISVYIGLEIEKRSW